MDRLIAFELIPVVSFYYTCVFIVAIGGLERPAKNLDIMRKPIRNIVMQQVQLSDQLFRIVQRRASEAGFATVAEYIADVVTQDSADDTQNFDHLFTPEIVAELEQISAAARAGGKTYTSDEVSEHFRKKSEQWRASHPE
jgi:hypothetical protein